MTSLANSGILIGAADCHSHILPHVDDGMSSSPESLAAIALQERCGIRNLWLTPHVMEDCPNTATELKADFERLKQRYNGPVELHLGAEYMLDNAFLSHLESGDILTTREDDMLLVETRSISGPINLAEIFSQIMKAGYRPLLAHPERYGYMSYQDYEQYRRMGVNFQLNLPSLAGEFGPDVRSRALDLLQYDFYYCFGSDAHRVHSLEDVYFGNHISMDIYEPLARISGK